jgi:hypothetical protein
MIEEATVLTARDRYLAIACSTLVSLGLAPLLSSPQRRREQVRRLRHTSPTVYDNRQTAANVS